MKQRIVLRALLGALGTVMLSAPSFAATYDLTVDYVEIDTGTMKTRGIGYNGSSPGPTLRFKEGEEVVINVTNNLDEATSIHWHGLILPYQMDGVPGISFPGIEPGETFTYRIPVSQSGTYWFHSHSGFQEPDGAYGSIIIEPQKREPFKFDREYVVVLKDKHPHSGERILRNLKMMPDYYNRNQRSLGDFIMDVRKNGLGATLSERADWGAMRMMPTDIEDVQGFVGLINGMSPEQNWTGLFHPEERVRLRFINASAMTYFDVRIPGLEMTVVQADGNNVQPVKVDEFRIAVAETYDVIVQPKDDKAYAIMTESMGRSGYGFGTLAPHEGMRAEVPELRKEAPLLTMADMGMNHGDMGHGDMAGMGHGAAPSGSAAMGNAAMDHGSAGSMPGMDHSGMAGMDHSNMTAMDHSKMAGMDHSAMAMGNRADPFYAAGSGLTPKAANGGKFLSYADLKAQKPLYADRPATREIELRLTGNMERYSWSINGVKYEDAEPIRLKYGERVRFKFVNETMMSHPMHLHGMWSILDTGQGKWNPVKHTININPGTTVYSETEVDEPGQWAFHCHLSYHMATGMFRKVVVEGGPAVATLKNGN
ncbi:copper resistance system multicopper oxidase [Thalassospira povalilytica]|uniref:copper resistance system multicopper oxidase n=1 Tax=Thalassospira povalilytica TaxID=732237 RepID=UPI001D1800AA|nr:copper resistance system multicopper oxidase [Thalassospira povalilytica]MCC4241560.1 copper resistance system multicopper oxidase [Thalassospira povalilytica]